MSSKEQLTLEEQHRYSRHLILDGFGKDAQLKLRNASVLVIGAGGLGCPALLYLAAAGVGRIGIIDDDKVDISNLQRQVLYSSSSEGQYKAEAARDRLNALNPGITLEPYLFRVSPENALKLVEEYDVIVDGSDNFATRYLANDACVIKNKPLIYGAIFKYEGQVSVFNYQGGPTYRCLFPEPPEPGEMPSCSEIGVLGVLPGLIGTYQATETIKVITGIGTPLSGTLLTVDTLTNRTMQLSIDPIIANQQITQLSSYDFGCEVSDLREIDRQTLERWQQAGKDFQLIDVREHSEYQAFNIGGYLLPLSQLEQRLHEIDPEIIAVVHCKSGQRSQKAIGILKEKYPEMDLFNLQGGIG